MLPSSVAALREDQLIARRKAIESSIASFRSHYDPRGWLSGQVSAMQSAGVYVSIGEGMDAFVPNEEIADECTMSSPASRRDGAPQLRPRLQIGETVEFRVIRHTV